MYISGDDLVELAFAHSLAKEVALRCNKEVGNKAVHDRGLHQ